MLNVASGQGYVSFLNEFHANVLLDWYMEIGCRNGRMFAPVRGKTIAIDPYFRTELNIIGSKPALHVFQQTSDDFFASGFLAANKIGLSLAFIDGMHLFEYLLRDFINVEANSAPGGMVLMHDCCPRNPEMTTRDLNDLPKEGGWTGDVWKIIPILKEFRPDLKVTVLGCKPTGLVLISNLSPKNNVLRENYDEIIARFTPITLLDFGVEAYNDCFAFTDPRRLAEDNYSFFDAIMLDPSLAIKPGYVSP